MIDFVRGAFGVSIRKACRAVPTCSATCHYGSRRPEQAPLRKRIREIAEPRMRYGYRKITVRLRREGWHVKSSGFVVFMGWKACKLRLKSTPARHGQAPR
jgi:putative transposase